MAVCSLPDEFVSRLNALGFALVEGGTSFTFLRVGSAGSVRLVVVPADPEWRVEIAADDPIQIGRLPSPSPPDGVKLLVSTAQLVEQVPRLLDASLPAWDMRPANDG
jgi:hypothetical protein